MSQKRTADRSPSTTFPEFDPALTEAYELIANQTRMRILIALWEVIEPGLARHPLTFTELRNRLGKPDPGNLNYHLNALTGRFIDRTEDGYVIRYSGLKIVHSVAASAGFSDASIELTPIDVACPHCGGQTAVRYEDEALYHVCTECDGTFSSPEFEEGVLGASSVEPAATVGRDVEELHALCQLEYFLSGFYHMQGICPNCRGPVERSLLVCEQHDDGKMCDTCGRVESVRGQFSCSVCKSWSILKLQNCIALHPAVVSFHYDRGITYSWDTQQKNFVELALQVTESDVVLVQSDPPRVIVRMTGDDSELRLTIDENLDVVEIETCDEDC